MSQPQPLLTFLTSFKPESSESSLVYHGSSTWISNRIVRAVLLKLDAIMFAARQSCTDLIRKARNGKNGELGR